MSQQVVGDAFKVQVVAHSTVTTRSMQLGNGMAKFGARAVVVLVLA